MAIDDITSDEREDIKDIGIDIIYMAMGREQLRNDQKAGLKRNPQTFFKDVKAIKPDGKKEKFSAEEANALWEIYLNLNTISFQKMAELIKEVPRLYKTPPSPTD